MGTTAATRARIGGDSGGDGSVGIHMGVGGINYTDGTASWTSRLSFFSLDKTPKPSTRGLG